MSMPIQPVTSRILRLGIAAALVWGWVSLSRSAMPPVPTKFCRYQAAHHDGVYVSYRNRMSIAHILLRRFMSTRQSKPYLQSVATTLGAL
jgi:hypothetical protein